MSKMKSNRPILKIELTSFDKVLELVSILILLFNVIYLAISYQSIPEIIPTHFNMAGKVDAYGPKSTSISLPIISLVLYIGLTILNRFPHQFNYIGEITLDNAASQYKFATRMMRVIKLIVMIVFLVITISVI